MSKPVRVRFAPSPTGPLHIGGVRTALFNYLFAKKHGGTFYLRVEDTDQNRFVPGAEEYIVEALNWLGIPFDEGVGKNEKFGPYRQSERKEIYGQYATQLIEGGWAYYAFDTAEALDEARKAEEAEGKTFIYNHTTRGTLDNSLNLSEEETAKRINNGEHYVIRFKVPVGEKLLLNDIIRGEVEFDTNLLDDKVLYKSDGMPTYHLANIVDDHLMETSHVIRGEEWLPSMPLHVLLYKAFGWDAPEFAHLPLILKPIGNGKLSKRDGDKMGFPVFPLEWKNADGTASMGYREQGFLPEAVINFLALLGWNPGTEQELFTLDELVQQFDLERVHKAGAKFNPEKNAWFNHQYFQKQDNDTIAKQFAPTLLEKGINVPAETVSRIIGLVKDRATFASELWNLTSYFFVTPDSYEEKAVAKQWKPDTGTLLAELAATLEATADFSSANTESVVKGWVEQKGIGIGKVMAPLRLSLVGDLKGPHLYDIMEIIGKTETINRINKAVETL
ncbi:glutamate--tRNA ligase [Flavobacterium sp. RHBU_3]|uniref:glutamate--tRNA ligase n=1 Tax=Flavobacterium sp. RHBU_3 TaxID=3391184 RepID=UPI0039850A93